METAPAIDMFDAMREAGWIVRGIHWDHQRRFCGTSDRTVTFQAKLPAGKFVYVLCREIEIVERIQEILDWK
jgi:hypothetical protein